MRKNSIFIFLLIGITVGSYAQQNSDTIKEERFSIHAQATVINQYKPTFHATYSGTNSLRTQEENQASITSTLYAGLRLWKGASVYLNPEIAGGAGLSKALGIASATNGETFRIGSPSPQIYLARLYYKQIFALTKNTTYLPADANRLAVYQPEKYLAITIGKIGVTDFFDANTFSHDPRTQFMSWGLMANGAWDYPANTRGYTPSIVLEYVSPVHELRYGISLVPLRANANDMNWDVSKANSQTLEYTHRHKIGGKSGAIRALVFFTMANMGNYAESVKQNPAAPDITATRAYGHTKYGFGINAEQYLTNNLGMFFRASWNDGHNETWAFTEIDRSASAGLSLNGSRWKRKKDVAGIAVIVSGISKPHRDYLQHGGNGFMLGDGNLNYAWEQLLETYYSAELVKDQLYVSGAYQFLFNPGYNSDRQGPVHVFSLRVHVKV